MSKYIEINPLIYTFAIIAILTASFINFIIISTLIIIHELGHFLTAKFLKVEVDKIYLYPLGGISRFYLQANASSLKELIILLMGPIFQFIAYTILLKIFPENIELIKIYHYGIIFFNLLPIYPLDGGKLIKLLLSEFIPYRNSLIITIIISYITIFLYVIITLHNLKLNNLIIIIFLLHKVKTESKNINQMYEKFLLERYLYRHNFKKKKIINSYKKFYKNATHLINENSKYYLEKEYLEKKYKKV